MVKIMSELVITKASTACPVFKVIIYSSITDNYTLTIILSKIQWYAWYDAWRHTRMSEQMM